jgi:RNA polymerase sigma-70 factor (ECF subfamily)
MDKTDSSPDTADATDCLSDYQRTVLVSLFKKYRSSLFRHLKGMVYSRDDAADLVQESYARLVGHSGAIQLEPEARAYLFRTATNLARDHFRRRVSRQTDRHIDIDEIAVAADGANPERALAWDEAMASLKQCLLSLPATTRRAFILSRFRGKTHAEIAVILGVSSRTVERKMSEAVEEFASRIGDAL